MNRHQLEHILRAAGAITDQGEFIIVGSQSILGAFPEVNNTIILQSGEVDIIPMDDSQDMRDLIDGTIGEASRFHRTFGVYAQGVALETSILPEGWRSRLLPVENENTNEVTGWCLEPEDLVLAKYAAGREKDIEFNREVIKEKLVDRQVLLERLETMELSDARKTSILKMIEYEFGPSKQFDFNLGPGC